VSSDKLAEAQARTDLLRKQTTQMYTQMQRNFEHTEELLANSAEINLISKDF
jgi:hypothetical protein